MSGNLPSHTDSNTVRPDSPARTVTQWRPAQTGLHRGGLIVPKTGFCPFATVEKVIERLDLGNDFGYNNT